MFGLISTTLCSQFTFHLQIKDDLFFVCDGEQLSWFRGWNCFVRTLCLQSHYGKVCHQTYLHPSDFFLNIVAVKFDLLFQYVKYILTRFIRTDSNTCQRFGGSFLNWGLSCVPNVHDTFLVAYFYCYFFLFFSSTSFLIQQYPISDTKLIFFAWSVVCLCHQS